MVREYIHEGQRLIEARERLGLTRAQLAEKLGQSERSIQEWEKGGNLPNGKSLQEYAKLNISPSWVLTGIGDIFLNQETITAIPVPELRFFHDNDQNDYEEVSKFSSLNFPEHTFTFKVVDDAMAVTYPKGVSVFVEPFHEEMPLEGQLLFWAHNHPSIRKVQPLIGNGIHLSCESPSIPDEVIKPDEFDHTTVIGRIIGYIDQRERN